MGNIWEFGQGLLGFADDIAIILCLKSDPADAARTPILTPCPYCSGRGHIVFNVKRNGATEPFFANCADCDASGFRVRWW